MSPVKVLTHACNTKHRVRHVFACRWCKLVKGEVTEALWRIWVSKRRKRRREHVCVIPSLPHPFVSCSGVRERLPERWALHRTQQMCLRLRFHWPAVRERWEIAPFFRVDSGCCDFLLCCRLALLSRRFYCWDQEWGQVISWVRHFTNPHGNSGTELICLVERYTALLYLKQHYEVFL